MRKIIMASITAVVVIAVLAGTLIPVLDDATATTDTFSNDGAFELLYTQTDDVTLVWDPTTPNVLTMNDTAVTMPTLANGEQRTVLCGDDWLIRLGYGTSLGGYFIQWYPSTGASILASVNNGYTLTVTCSSGTVSVTDNAATPNTATGSYTYLYAVTDDGSYVMKDSADSVYVNGDTEIYAMGLTNVGSISSVGIKITGSIDDGMTWSVFRGTDGFEFTNQAVNYSAVSGHEDLYELTSMTATITNGDDTVNATYSYFIVPAEITAEKSVHFTDGENAIFNAIPVIVIVALLLGVVAIVLRSRMD